MPKCYICNYYDPKQMSLYRVPNRNDEYCERSGLWLKLLEEDAKNIDKIRVCSKHFLKKKPAKTGDYLDIDWVPNKNLGRFSKNWKLVEKHFRKQNKTSLAQNLHRPVEENLKRKSDSVVLLKVGNGIVEATNSNDDVDLATIGSRDANLAKLKNLIYNDVSAVRKNDNDAKTFMKFNPNIEESSNNVFLVDRSTIICARSGIYRASKEAVPGWQVKTVGPDARNKILLASKGKIEINKVQAFIPSGIQTDLSHDDIDRIFKYYQESVEERNDLLKKIAQLVIDFDFFKENNKKTRFYTGLPTWSLLNNFFEMIKEFLPQHYNCKLSRFQMLALTLMKLRLNLSFTDLGYRFRVDETTASRYFHRCIFILFKLFNNSKLVHWPDERQNLLLNVPSYFRSTFKEKITIIVDCFETFTEKSTILRAAAQGFSFYKHHETLKYLIGISLTGVILFVSIGFGGRASDKEVVRKSGFLDKIQEGDVVLGDKGFLIEDEMQAKKALLKRPSFVKKGSQLHPTEVEQSRDYARIRIHVERVICILREKFNICADIVQMSTVAKQNDLFDRDLYDKVIFICSCFVNICPSVVPNYFEM